jgi:hypothetical protein
LNHSPTILVAVPSPLRGGEGRIIQIRCKIHIHTILVAAVAFAIFAAHMTGREGPV